MTDNGAVSPRYTASCLRFVAAVGLQRRHIRRYAQLLLEHVKCIIRQVEVEPWNTVLIADGPPLKPQFDGGLLATSTLHRCMEELYQSPEIINSRG